MPDVTTTESPAASTRPADSFRPKAPRRGRKRLVRAIVLLIALAAVAAGSFYAWKYFSAYESTDDAEVDGNINAISARINGYVVDVPVDNERYVKAGDVLARIDPKDYTVALAQAEADLAAAEASFQGSRTDVPVTSTTTSSQLTSARSGKVDAAAALLGAQRQLSAAQARLVTAQANVREAEATYKKNADDVARYKMLVDKDEISQQIYDTAVNTANSANATVDARRAAVAEAEDNVRVAQSRHRSGQRTNCAGGCFHPIRANCAAAGSHQPGARQNVRSPGASKTRCRRPSPAESQLLHDCRAGKRHRRKEERRGGKQRLTGPGVDGSCTFG